MVKAIIQWIKKINCMHIIILSEFMITIAFLCIGEFLLAILCFNIFLSAILIRDKDHLLELQKKEIEQCKETLRRLQ